MLTARPWGLHSPAPAHVVGKELTVGMLGLRHLSQMKSVIRLPCSASKDGLAAPARCRTWGPCGRHKSVSPLAAYLRHRPVLPPLSGTNIPKTHKYPAASCWRLSGRLAAPPVGVHLTAGGWAVDWAARGCSEGQGGTHHCSATRRGPIALASTELESQKRGGDISAGQACSRMSR